MCVRRLEERRRKETGTRVAPSMATATVEEEKEGGVIGSRDDSS